MEFEMSSIFKMVDNQTTITSEIITIISEMDPVYISIFIAFSLISLFASIYFNGLLFIMIYKLIRLQFQIKLQRAFPYLAFTLKYSNYYPVLFLIILLNILYVAANGSIVVPALLDCRPTQFYIPILIVTAASYPAIACILDFILCVHRFSLIFLDAESLPFRIRLIEPLILLISSPLLCQMIALSSIYAANQLGYQVGTIFKYRTLFDFFATELFLIVVFNGISLGVYLVILARVARQFWKFGRTNDFTAIKQAIPVSGIQFIANILMFFMYNQSIENPWNFGKIIMIKYVITQILCVVIPIAILRGNSHLWQKFKRSGICCRRRTIQISPIIGNDQVIYIISAQRDNLSWSSFAQAPN
ncbi:unnamed protein product [Caenorhabditis bovis]|uniref:Serpentine receptor class gamma n=1 Tax=Caenorhabditis bovis TaxID=2654633 RepID=A0A8S1ENR0_9PELO|nr:unnamed protein product [Caenorhabditis bovis]